MPQAYGFAVFSGKSERMNLHLKSAVCLAVVCLSPIVASASDPIAYRDKLPITIEDLEAQHFMLSDARKKALLNSEIELFQSIDDGLNARVYAQIIHQRKEYSKLEQHYIQSQVERAYLAAALNVHERRVRAAFKPESNSIGARAKEVWLADTDKFLTEESVDISQIYFDTLKRNWRETQQRIDEATAKLRSGDTFESVVRQYSDDPAASATSGKIQDVRCLSLMVTYAPYSLLSSNWGKFPNPRRRDAAST